MLLDLEEFGGKIEFFLNHFRMAKSLSHFEIQILEKFISL